MKTLRNSRVARPHVATPDPGSWIVETGGGGGGGGFSARTISGVQDGANIIFTVPVALTAFQLFRNGILLSPSLPGKPRDYTFTTGSGVTTIAISVWPVAIKGSVANAAALPASGNQLNDGWVTADTGHLWVWGGTAGVAPRQWLVGTTYAQGNEVVDAGVVYFSLQASNVGHTPATSPTWWGAGRGQWLVGTTYVQGDEVVDAGVVYFSLQAGNVGHTPAASPTWWQAGPWVDSTNLIRGPAPDDLLAVWG